ncbi:heavy metal-associated isoprenylated plant protein 26 [Phtheirospermum japonicum]|uniref:Heavy metal-associated isoprenylated plant protein 26 n=1 Tax=Phtheirospermum japonicum TaxID=374723 RepID=A0A830BXV1_9LAMI|nr:heavy metal-associated isoprenylated plant protein 26 [Phtheirospermum japonicum]
MGEEEKKPEEAKKEKSEEAPKPEKPAAEGEKKSEEPKAEEQAPPPPQEIVLKVYMHCEGCARKVRRCLKGFEGVEDVTTDCRTSKVIVKGEKADPLKVLERVQRKSHRQPIVISAVLGVYMHCEACAQEIKKRILRMKGVENAEPDLKSSQVKVKGVFEPEKLVDYVHKRTGKHATIIKVEPDKKEEEKPKEGKEDNKKPEKDEKEKDAKKGGGDEANKENKEGGGGGDAGGESGGAPPPEKPEAAEDSKLELKKNEFYYYYPQNHQVYYPQRFVQEYHAYPPQIFSDENPNACTVM